MQFRNDGKLFLSYIDYNASKDSGGVFLVTSPDGGMTWGTPVKMIDLHEDQTKKPLDRPWLALDNSNTANKGMLYVTTKPAPWVAAPCRPYFKSSTDSGQTWSIFRYVDTTNYLVGNLIQAPMAANATTADGAVCAVYPSYVASQSVYLKYYLAKSYNRGAGFQYSSVLTNPTPVGDTNFKAGYHLAANPANANQMAFVFIDNRNGDPDIFVVSTNNGGQSWSNPLRVNNDAMGNGKAQDMPWADYNETGDLLVTWRDRRNGSGTGFYQQPFETYAAISNNNATSFGNNLNLCTVLTPFDSALAQKGNDFLCCKLVSDTIYAAWADFRTGNMNVFFAKMVDSVATGIIRINTEEIELLQVSPNPSNGDFSVSHVLNDANELKLLILDDLGKIVFEKDHPARTEKINTSKFSAGVYFVKLIAEEYSETKRIILNK
jgi:hypothetical protein